jgi:predicted lipase
MPLELEDVQKAVLGIGMAYTHSRNEEKYKIYDKLLAKQFGEEKIQNLEMFFKEGDSSQPVGFVISTEKESIVCYRGTLNKSEMKSDLSLMHKEVNFGGEKVNLHGGFVDEYNKSRLGLETILAKHSDKEIIFSGHSLGGALATIAALDFSSREEKDSPGEKKLNIKGVVTFGAPRGMSRAAAALYNKRGLDKKTIRIEQKLDPITKIPPYGFYQHVGQTISMHAPLSEKVDNSLPEISQLYKNSSSFHETPNYQKISNKIDPEMFNKLMSGEQVIGSIASYIKDVLEMSKEYFVLKQANIEKSLKGIISEIKDVTSTVSISYNQALKKVVTQRSHYSHGSGS